MDLRRRDCKFKVRQKGLVQGRTFALGRPSEPSIVEEGLEVVEVYGRPMKSLLRRFVSSFSGCTLLDPDRGRNKSSGRNACEMQREVQKQEAVTNVPQRKTIRDC